MPITLNAALLLLLLLLSAWNSHAVLGQEKCESDYIEVAADNDAAGIGGCYRKSDELSAHGKAVYTSKGGGIDGFTYVILGSLNAQNRILWVIIGVLPSHTGNYDDYGGGSDFYSGVHATLKCIGGSDWGTESEPPRVRNWKCDTNEDKVFTLEEGFESLHCGCSEALKHAAVVHEESSGSLRASMTKRVAAAVNDESTSVSGSSISSGSSSDSSGITGVYTSTDSSSSSYRRTSVPVVTSSVTDDDFVYDDDSSWWITDYNVSTTTWDIDDSETSAPYSVTISYMSGSTSDGSPSNSSGTDPPDIPSTSASSSTHSSNPSSDSSLAESTGYVTDESSPNDSSTTSSSSSSSDSSTSPGSSTSAGSAGPGADKNSSEGFVTSETSPTESPTVSASAESTGSDAKDTYSYNERDIYATSSMSSISSSSGGSSSTTIGSSTTVDHQSASGTAPPSTFAPLEANVVTSGASAAVVQHEVSTMIIHGVSVVFLGILSNAVHSP